ncbi:GNAT family N-acetyltransferase [Hyunsoonleella flava]|uniref:GNAT family N-acetyltransferase n=1 Tax=Hyunsoonleella flava TaxID=2527939 RepID=A0A4Q9FKA7_9FLAO|nr:GNAT family N-acetyltransferase [Hyunsoonleella flava]TBN06874.1 GNAT family N-acetyltransferase [Hyunsoonleella flava]
MISFTEAIEEHHFNTIEILANSVWHEHYIPIIGKAQVDYMLKKFQSRGAIKQQIKDGYHYFLMETHASNIGYLCIKKKSKSLFLSKLYLLKIHREKGFGKQALAFIETKAKNMDCNTISLTVNKNNLNSMKAYEKVGFKNIGDIIIDIGNGFVMDDYKMEKSIV